MSRLRSWADSDLTLAVASSLSYREVIIKLKLVPAGGNYMQVQTRITQLNLDTSHFTGKRWNKGKKYHTKTRPSIEQLLTLGSEIQSYKLKMRLFESKLKQPKCEIRGWSEQSVDGRVPVELDHINGNHFDNRLENLRILCPNCHSLQITHRGKNKKVRLKYQ